ncbi:MAG: Stk1 family PASTA domain-containing Ser/Thr kinase [Clostridiales bacterium]|nr:Stk1 family PASTA domain-containing Ser/Thr kinase [Clostridiales bacterium]
MNVLKNRYEIIEKIGSGGMSIVYKAFDRNTGKEVAVKMLRQELTEDKQLLRRFEREVKAIASLSHPNIVQFIDSGESDTNKYFVLEYVNGITLKEYIDAEGKIPPKEAAKIALKVALALQYAHSKGIVHRDVKPQNILLGTDGTVRLTDFGIARTLDQNSTRTTQYGKDMLGTVYYISPEQVQAKEVDGRTDIYSLGVVLYEMVTGKVPFVGDSSVNVAMQHVNKKPEAISSLVGGIPSSFENIVNKAMAKKLVNRYSNVAAVIEDLRKFLKNPSVVIKYKEVIPDLITEGQSSVQQKKTPPIFKKYWFRLTSNIMVLCVLCAVLFGMAYYAIDFGRKIYDINFTATEIVVPNVVNMTEEEARQLLKNNSLIMRVEEVSYSSTVSAGYIISQSPLESEKVGADTHVDVVVSAGKQMITIPSVIGNTVTEAQYILSSNRFIKVSVEEVDSDEPKGIVLEQSVPAGEISLESSVIEIVLSVSKGPVITTTKVPNLVGILQSSAIQLLDAYDLKIGTVLTEYSSEYEADVVIFQSIPKDTEVDKGTKINITVSLGKKVYYPKDIVVTWTPDPAKPTVNVKIVKYVSNAQQSVVYQSDVDATLGTTTVTLTEEGMEVYDVYVDDVFLKRVTLDFSVQ